MALDLLIQEAAANIRQMFVQTQAPIADKHSPAASVVELAARIHNLAEKSGAAHKQVGHVHSQQGLAFEQVKESFGMVVHLVVYTLAELVALKQVKGKSGMVVRLLVYKLAQLVALEEGGAFVYPKPVPSLPAALLPQPGRQETRCLLVLQQHPRTRAKVSIDSG